MKLKDESYLMVKHDDEQVTFEQFDDKEAVIKHINELFDDEEQKMSWQDVLDWIENTFVDGDSFEAYNLIYINDGELSVIAGEIFGL